MKSSNCRFHNQDDNQLSAFPIGRYRLIEIDRHEKAKQRKGEDGSGTGEGSRTEVCIEGWLGQEAGDWGYEGCGIRGKHKSFEGENEVLMG